MIFKPMVKPVVDSDYKFLSPFCNNNSAKKGLEMKNEKQKHTHTLKSPYKNILHLKYNEIHYTQRPN